MFRGAVGRPASAGEAGPAVTIAEESRRPVKRSGANGEALLYSCDDSSQQGSLSQNDAGDSRDPPREFTNYYTIPVTNRYDILSQRTPTGTYMRDKHPQHQRDENTGYAHVTENNPSPADILNDITVKHRTTALIIGDSVIRYLDTKRLGIRSYVVQKVCVPGMTTEDLRQWLSKQPENLYIRALIVHVGINDCPSGQVTVAQWSGVMDMCSKAFPYAKLAFSSIVPAKGRHNLNNTVFPSNRNQRSACTQYNIAHIDNTDSFTAVSGAPKQAMYNDLTHPSSKGTAQLASKMKMTILDWYAEELQFERKRQTNGKLSRVPPHPPSYGTSRQAASFAPHYHVSSGVNCDSSNDHTRSIHLPPQQNTYAISRYGDGEYAPTHVSRDNMHIYDRVFGSEQNPSQTERQSRQYDNGQVPPSVQSMFHYPPLDLTNKPQAETTTPVHPNYVQDRHERTQFDMHRRSERVFDTDNSNLGNHRFGSNSQNIPHQADVHRYLYLINRMTSQILQMQANGQTNMVY